MVHGQHFSFKFSFSAGDITYRWDRIRSRYAQGSRQVVHGKTSHRNLTVHLPGPVQRSLRLRAVLVAGQDPNRTRHFHLSRDHSSLLAACQECRRRRTSSKNDSRTQCIKEPADPRAPSAFSLTSLQLAAVRTLQKRLCTFQRSPAATQIRPRVHSKREQHLLSWFHMPAFSVLLRRIRRRAVIMCELAVRARPGPVRWV